MPDRNEQEKSANRGSSRFVRLPRRLTHRRVAERRRNLSTKVALREGLSLNSRARRLQSTIHNLYSIKPIGLNADALDHFGVHSQTIFFEQIAEAIPVD